MTKENPKIKSVLRSLFQVAVDKLVRENPSAINFLYIQFEQESGEVQVYDDRERLLHKKVIFDWIGADIKDKHFLSRMLSVYRHVIELLVTEGSFDYPFFMRPFSIRLVDEDYKKIAEIYTIKDDDALPETDVLMKGLDKELDDFLKKLLSDDE